MKSVSCTIIFLAYYIIGKTNGQLYTDEVSDGICTNIPVARNLTSCLPTMLTPQVYSVRIGSNALYRNYAESFLGRPARNKAELDSMCFTFAFAEALVIQCGYAAKANIRTAIPTDLKLEILPTPLGLGKFLLNSTLAQSPGSTTDNQYTTIDTIAWCDSSNFLIVRCVNGTRQDWKVASVGDPAPWVFPLVLKKIKSMGMPPQNAIQYKSVKNGGKCPVVPNLVTYTAKALVNVGFPLAILRILGIKL